MNRLFSWSCSQQESWGSASRRPLSWKCGVHDIGKMPIFPLEFSAGRGMGRPTHTAALEKIAWLYKFWGDTDIGVSGQFAFFLADFLLGLAAQSLLPASPHPPLRIRPPLTPGSFEASTTALPLAQEFPKGSKWPEKAPSCPQQHQVWNCNSHCSN